jgi:hypothetical protein
MNRKNLSALALAVLLALAALASGCGGGSKDEQTAAKPTPQEQLSDDADAKSNARNLASQTEACYVEETSYSRCAVADGGRVAGEDTGLPTGDAAGQVTSTTEDQGYEITAKSKSGNTFVLSKSGGAAMERSCTTQGEGGCPEGGAW